MSHINKKDVIRINQEIGEKGVLRNEGSLEHALSRKRDNKSWLIELSTIVRSLLVDHAFEDGNKRTALVTIVTYLEERGLAYEKDSLIKTVWLIAKKNVNNTNRIARMIKNDIIF